MLKFLQPSGYRTAAVAIALSCTASSVWAQAVCLPAPRLLTTTPMGGKIGTQVEVTIAGDHLDELDELSFSDARLKATRKLDAAGTPIANQYVVSIPQDCPVGVYEARVMTRLGMSSSRVFSVGSLTEVSQKKPNTTLATALELPMNSVCNAVISARAVDHYSFEAKQGQRVIVDCATRGIDSKLDATVIIADAAGRDLLVERRGGVLDFTVPADGKYVIKVHELTFKGGREFFYRLGLWEQPVGTPIVRQPVTKTVNSFSWPPQGLPEKAPTTDAEPNNSGKVAQKISLPCDVAGSFFPAADVDVFEFEAKKGEEWWIEVASERFGLPTDPNVLVQHVAKTTDGEKVTDVAEFNDIPSPVKVSSNGYAYDGPPYNAGSADVLGKLVIKEDGLHRLQLTDLFGGTRTDARNVYRLVVRKAAPDFALVAWAMHMELRNGDRNALSKPLALRGGATMALEVVAIRRDGFDGEIDLTMENLPDGVTASGLKIPAGQSRGIMLVSASQNAPRGLTSAKFIGRATVNNEQVIRPCALASFAWPIADSWGEIPAPRLMVDVPVSVSGRDFSPLTISPQKGGPIEATVGEKISVPLFMTRRSDFSGATMDVRVAGAVGGFERVPLFKLPLNADQSQFEIDLGTLKTVPGDYTIALYGGAVAKYRHNPEQVSVVDAALVKAKADVAAVEADVTKATEAAKTAAEDKKAESEKLLADLNAKLTAAKAVLTAADANAKAVTAAAQPKDIVDIVVSEPITIRVKAK